MRFYESVYLSSYLSIGVLSNQELTTVFHSIVINFTDVVIVLQKLSSFYRSCHPFTEVVIDFAEERCNRFISFHKLPSSVCAQPLRNGLPLNGEVLIKLYIRNYTDIFMYHNITDLKYTFMFAIYTLHFVTYFERWGSPTIFTARACSTPAVSSGEKKTK